MAEWTKHRNKLEECLTDTICEDDVLDFLDIRYDVQSKVATKLKNMSDDEFESTWDMYVLWTIEDEIADMGEE